MRILFINNKDSFVYNLVDYVMRVSKSKVTIVDNSITLMEVEEIAPDRIIISPGPGHPRDTGMVIPLIKHFYEEIPILGVCLGHQAIFEAFGGRVERAKVGPVHGKVSMIHHDGKRIYRNADNPFEATRYHSLEGRHDSMPQCLKVTATVPDGTIMGIRHLSAPMEGVQFHPESIITMQGLKILRNFVYQVE
ncbi:MAG: aminodeoxychorismate/anthranilate synthase component II [Nitrososphaeria archaeon]|nr:aminodeoxychorismate/anthranilate synthase component II [Nitrososphaeria archaeon]NIN51886.1 aminodeoxychorismate/anthranilate synthase component II [Nitrososphaeria archaeon]NIQ32434.1 aminodeoxychorismate/anthranilate synthase component II [Nitrososphaeria archaeon]